MQPVTVRTTVSSASGTDNVQLYYSNNIVGKFSKTPMYDDGLNNDSLAGDGIYGGTIPGFAAGTWVRYYIQAASANTAKSVRYLPEGAEHDVFLYTVAPQLSADSGLVINEIMASNSSTEPDNFGEFDDWIELYNKSSIAKDLSGFFLTDNPVNLDKWEFPAGTIVQPNEYLILWADEDSSQGPYHANFKLSAGGEMLYLLDPAMNMVDSLTWGQQITDKGLARVPNGTGNFVIQNPTFAANNNPTGLNEIPASATALSVYPNPARSTVQIQLSDDARRDLEIFDMTGRAVLSRSYAPYYSLHIGNWEAGVYLIRCGSAVKRLIVEP
jgi:hypothetical protein